MNTTTSEFNQPKNDITSTENESMKDTANTKPSPVQVPSRTTSNQLPNDSNPTSSQVATAATMDPPPSPRRGSKRSLLSRSRNGSRSSRKSARATRTIEASKEPVPPIPQPSRPTEKKKAGSFLAFLSCCLPSDDLDTIKNEEPDVPAKKSKVQQLPSRTSRVTDESQAIETEKQDKGQLEGKDAGAVEEKDDKPTVSAGKPSDESNAEISEKITPVQTRQVPDSKIGREIKDDHPTNPDVNLITPTPIETKPVESSTQQIPTNDDVEMTEEHSPMEDEPLDEPPQPADEQPQIPLPPPPPITERQKQLDTKELTTTSDTSEKQSYLLPAVEPHLKGRKCLVLDLDETLVHSSFKILNQADFTIPVEIEGQYHNVYVIKRPGVDAFMKRVGELYEVVVFTASVSKYGDPLLDQLDIHHVVHHRLFRESCYNHQGNYVKVSVCDSFPSL